MLATALLPQEHAPPHIAGNMRLDRRAAHSATSPESGIVRVWNGSATKNPPRIDSRWVDA
jgi:hypothetical protein